MVAVTLESREIRFIIVGVVSALALFLLSWALLASGMQPFLGQTLAYGVVFACTYLLHKTWSFRTSQSHARSFPRYLATQLAAAGLSGAVAWAGAHWLGLGDMLVSASATIVASAASYLLSSRWAFA